MLANALFSADLVSKEAAEGALEGYLDVSEGALLAPCASAVTRLSQELARVERPLNHIE